MEVIAKINWNPIFVKSVSIKDDLKNFATADITIDFIEWLAQFQEVEIYEIEKEERLVFTWFVNNFIIWDFITINAQGQKALLYNKLLPSNKSYESQTRCFILQDVINSWNSFTSDNLTLDCTLTGTISKELKEWDSLYDIISDIAWDKDWTMKDRNIIVWSIWNEIDFEVFYNPLEPYASNINNVRLEGYWTQANIVIVRAWNDRTNRRDLSAMQEPIAIYENIREWNVWEEAEKILAERKIPQNLLKIDLQSGFDFLNIWDILKVQIENLDSYRDYTWTARVNTINIEYINGTRIFTAWLSDNIIKRDDFLEKLRDISKNQRLSIL